MPRGGIPRPIALGTVMGHWTVGERAPNDPGKDGWRYHVVGVCGQKAVMFASTLRYHAKQRTQRTCRGCRSHSAEQYARQDRRVVFVRCLHPVCGTPVRSGQEAQHTADVHANSEHAPRFSEPFGDCDWNTDEEEAA